MGKFIDLTGQRFGRLTVLERAENSKHGSARWNCICDCGRTTVALGGGLRRGSTKSCGCLQSEIAKECRKENNSKIIKKFNAFRVDKGEVIVQLSNTDKEMITDLDIWEQAKNYCWHLTATGYAAAEITETRKVMLFHIFAFPDCPDGFVRDHISGNKLDNRRSNIRFVRQCQNSQNRGVGRNNTSGHIGVSWNKARRKWYASIMIKRRSINLGYFSNLQDAIAAREAAEIKYFGEYRRKK